MSNKLVIYHADCWDGFCAAWLFHWVFPDAEYHAAHYGTPPPDCNGKDVYIADFSYKRPVMQQIYSQANRLVVLDHHKTAEAELCGFAGEEPTKPFHVEFCMEKSGARLAWEYLCSYHKIVDAFLRKGRGEGLCRDVAPWLVGYTEDRDLWRWKLPHSREINTALRSYPLDFAQWDELLTIQPPHSFSFLSEGKAILRREQQIIAEHIRHAREIEMGGHKVLAVNATVLFSEIAGELAKDRPFGACYFDCLDGKRQWSLRSAETGIDVSEIAKTFGGDGHKHAAGFETVARYEVLESSR